jgi:putative two-component system response regulator
MHIAQPDTAYTVLVADDDTVVREMLCAAVQRAGYNVIPACDGLEAWEQIKSGGVRIVVSDWEMPGLNGIGLCRLVRQAGLSAYVYFLLVTSRNSSEDSVAGLSAGADDFLSKPVNLAELEVRLRAGARLLALESRDVVIFAMAKLAESRDPETGAHIERMQSCSRLMAEQVSTRFSDDARIPPDFASLVEATSPLHDIGKIGVPDSILLKPGRFNDEEFSIMKNHTVIGAEALDAALRVHPHAAFLQTARDIALYHHERYDGSGYPEGLVGEAIPLSARVVALADVYDALTSKRLYKDRFTHLVSRNLIAEGRGQHFDPVLTDIFLDIAPQFEEISDRFQAEATQV